LGELKGVPGDANKKRTEERQQFQHYHPTLEPCQREKTRSLKCEGLLLDQQARERRGQKIKTGKRIDLYWGEGLITRSERTKQVKQKAHGGRNMSITEGKRLQEGTINGALQKQPVCEGKEVGGKGEKRVEAFS